MPKQSGTSPNPDGARLDGNGCPEIFKQQWGKQMTDGASKLRERLGKYMTENLCTMSPDAICVGVVAKFVQAELSDTIAATKETCAKTGHKAAFEYLNMHRDQRTYSWHEVEDALTEASKAIRALPGPDLSARDEYVRKLELRLNDIPGLEHKVETLEAALALFAGQVVAHLYGDDNKDEDDLPNDPFDMGIYPAAVSGCAKEHNYEQRDGYKNGWNAACKEFIAIKRKMANEILALVPNPNALAEHDAALVAKLHSAEKHYIRIQVLNNEQAKENAALKARIAELRKRLPDPDDWHLDAC